MPLIRCLSSFPGGTQLPVGDRIYHFVRNRQGHHVADVLEKDVWTVLSIGAGYQLYDAQVAAAEAPAPERTTPKTVRKETGGDTFEEKTSAFLQPATRIPDKPLHRPLMPDAKAADTPEPKAKVKAGAKKGAAKKAAGKVLKTPARKAATGE